MKDMTMKDVCVALVAGKKLHYHTWKPEEYCYLDDDGTLMTEEDEVIAMEDPAGYEIYVEPAYYWNYLRDTEYGGGKLCVTDRRYTKEQAEAEFTEGFTIIGIVEGV